MPQILISLSKTSEYPWGWVGCMSGGTKNYYELLGVARDATPQVIRDSYKELARIYHPDSHYFDDILAEAGVGGGEVPAAPSVEDTFKAITDAYNTLNNAAKRGEYDAMLPKETPDWDADVRNDFVADQRQRQFENPDASQTFSWGNFGRSSSSDEAARFGKIAKAANEERMTDDELGYRSVSQMIRQQNSITARFKRLFGL